MFQIDFTIKNGWILSLVWLIISCVPMFFGGKAVKRLTDFSWMGKNGWMYSWRMWAISLLLLAVPVFSSITGNRTLLIIGLALFVIGSIGTVISFHNYFTTPLDQLITKGLYRISRNPIYVCLFIATVGMSVLCSSCIMAIALVAYFFLQHPVILEEEKFCAEIYGETYLAYKKQTGRYL